MIRYSAVKEDDLYINRMKFYDQLINSGFIVEKSEGNNIHIFIPNVIKQLKDELAKDKSEGSYYHSWQANIAMAFVDEFDENFKIGKDIIEVKQDLHQIANNAAKRFLDQLIGEK